MTGWQSLKKVPPQFSIKFLFKIFFFSTFTLFLILTGPNCRKEKEVELTVIHAGSLSVPFKQAAQAFTAEYPSVKVNLESHGSLTCARRIIDLGQKVDVFGSADSAVIRSLLIPEHASYCIDFASNEMVIMYRPQSLLSDKITLDNWYDILLNPDVEYGRSEPNSDPCGYRTLLSWQLAEAYYNHPGLYQKLEKNCPPANIRPKEVDLLALLETGELDYIFIYRSVAHQHGGLYLELPQAVNLGSPQWEDFYRRASVEIQGKTPEEKIIRQGAPMIYGLTVLRNAPNPEWGVRFAAFLLGAEGCRIMEKNGQPVLKPPRVDNFEALPAELKKLVDPDGGYNQ
ncbi:MAG: extracellular solute-binding protein [Acidobacteriota bacterium]